MEDNVVKIYSISLKLEDDGTFGLLEERNKRFFDKRELDKMLNDGFREEVLELLIGRILKLMDDASNDLLEYGKELLEVGR